jgi:hypothetical protein
VFLRWPRRHPVAVFSAAFVIVVLALLTGRGSKVDFCPVCGPESVETGLRILGIPMTVREAEPEPCLVAEHRFILAGASWGFWWKDGETHVSGVAGGFRWSYHSTLGPWLRARAPSDVDRQEYGGRHLFPHSVDFAPGRIHRLC